MTSNTDHDLFEFAASNRRPKTDDERLLHELHEALSVQPVPNRVRQHGARVTPLWQRIGYAAAAMLLVLATVAGSYLALRPLRSDDRLATAPPVVLGLASPDTDAATCDLSQDMPLITGVRESPFDGTSILLTPDGDLVMTCDGSRTVLLTDVDGAFMDNYPGLISIRRADGESVYNLRNGKEYRLSANIQEVTDTAFRVNYVRGPSRLEIVPSVSNPANAAVLDLETFDETPLTRNDGRAVPYKSITLASHSYDNEWLVAAVSRYDSTTRSDTLDGYVIYRVGQLPRFARATETAALPRELAMSPDGAFIATATYEGRTNGGTTTIEVARRDSGEIVTRHEVQTPNALTHLTWLKDGDGIVYSDGSNVYLLASPLDEAEPATIVESGSIESIMLTRDPHVIAVSSFDDQIEEGGGVPRTFIVDVMTGQAQHLDGIDVRYTSSTQPQERNILLLASTWVPSSDGPADIQVYDAATGASLGTIPHMAQSSGTLNFAQYGYAWSRPEIGAISLGADDIWLLIQNGEPVLIHLPMPPGTVEQQSLDVLMSENGWISAYSESGTYIWLLNANDPESGWTEMTFDADAENWGLQFITGID